MESQAQDAAAAQASDMNNGSFNMDAPPRRSRKLASKTVNSKFSSKNPSEASSDDEDDSSALQDRVNVQHRRVSTDSGAAQQQQKQDLVYDALEPLATAAAAVADAGAGTSSSQPSTTGGKLKPSELAAFDDATDFLASLEEAAMDAKRVAEATAAKAPSPAPAPAAAPAPAPAAAPMEADVLDLDSFLLDDDLGKMGEHVAPSDMVVEASVASSHNNNDATMDMAALNDLPPVPDQRKIAREDDPNARWPTEHPAWVEAYTGIKRRKLPERVLPHPDLKDLPYETDKFKEFYFRVGDLVYCPFTPKGSDVEIGYFGYIDRKFHKQKNSKWFSYSIDFDDGDYVEEIYVDRLSSAVEVARINAEFVKKGTDIPLTQFPTQPRSGLYSRRRKYEEAAARKKKKAIQQPNTPVKAKKAPPPTPEPTPVAAQSPSVSPYRVKTRPKASDTYLPVPDEFSTPKRKIVADTTPVKRQKSSTTPPAEQTPKPATARAKRRIPKDASPISKPKPKPPKPSALHPFDSIAVGEEFTITEHPPHIEAYTGVKRARLPTHAVPHPDLSELEFETQEFKDFYLRVGDLVYCPFLLDTGEEGGFLGYIDAKFKTSPGSTYYTYAVDFDDGDYEDSISSERLSPVVELARINAEFRRRGSSMPLYKKPKPRSWEFTRHPQPQKTSEAPAAHKPKRKNPVKLPSPKKKQAAKPRKPLTQMESSLFDEDDSIAAESADFAAGPAKKPLAAVDPSSAPIRGRLKSAQKAKKPGPRKKRKKPEPLPGRKGRGSNTSWPTAQKKFNGKKYSQPNPKHIDPSLREFRFETQQYKDHYFEEGDLVYCPFGEDKAYFWGYIDKKFYLPGQVQAYYDIDFDDGDYLEGSSSLEIYSLDEWGKIHKLSKYFNIEPPKSGSRTWKHSRRRSSPLKSQDNGSQNDDLDDDISASRIDIDQQSAAGDPEPLSLRDLWVNRCRGCTNCRKKPCKKCNSCIRGAKPFEVCLQNMCCQRPVESKAQSAPGLPIGWKFYFNSDESHSNKSLGGLVILPQGPHTHQTVEEAMESWADVYDREEFEPKAFYLHVGINTSADNQPISKPKPSQKVQNQVQPQGKAHSSSDPYGNTCEGPNRFSLCELYDRRCKRCARCRMRDCGKCISCSYNYANASAPSAPRDVCLRKMCSRIPPEAKKQQIEGLPHGWCFYFEDRSDMNLTEIHPDLADLLIVSPDNDIYDPDDVPDGVSADGLYCLYEVIGTRLLKEIEDHPLLNRDFSAEWINAAGETCQVVGSVTKAEKSGIDQSITCTVAFGDMVRGKPDPLFDVKGCVHEPMPEAKEISEVWAWAGCRRSEDSRISVSGSSSQLPPCPRDIPNVSWKVPKIIHAGYDEPSSLPSLEMTVDDFFKLEFCVKKSTISQAGYGVFVRCVSRQPHQSNGQHPLLELPPGCLIDLGVYGPLLESDIKPDFLYIAKNFIHSFEPEEYCFDSSDNEIFLHRYFDITDDSTGKLHTTARRHITPFVNEIVNPAHQTSCVHSAYDCQGALHYLLGHFNESDGPFQLPADGQLHEIFVDYGTGYESIRVRKGYPRCPADKMVKAKEKLKQTEEEYLDALENARASEIMEIVQFLERIFHGRSILNLEATSNAVVVLVVLKKRVKAITRDLPAPIANRKTNDTASVASIDASSLADRIGKLTEEVFDYLGNDEEMRSKLHEHPILIKTVAGDDPDEAIRINYMSADEFRPTIVDF